MLSRFDKDSIICEYTFMAVDNIDLIRRVYSEKKAEYAVEAEELWHELHDIVGITGLADIRILHRYDISGIHDEVFSRSLNTIFSEPPVDILHIEDFPFHSENIVFAVEYLPGQYDQRADSAEQALRLLEPTTIPHVRSATIYVLEGTFSSQEIEAIKKYCINPVDSHEAELAKPDSLTIEIKEPEHNIPVFKGFNDFNQDQLQDFCRSQGMAMSTEDLLHCQKYFRDIERRDPTETELKVIDTYWSDHCRHTTFLTEITHVDIPNGDFQELFQIAETEYQQTRQEVLGKAALKEKPACLMDMATIGMKWCKQQGLLNDLDESEEINACSIRISVNTDTGNEDWLLMFKNETHNHPTEIEPFGGAATCLGGAIRDPLSGRSYVYQAMRVTGSGDPRQAVKDTLPSKLPQRKITREAAHGYSSYGNQIGLATGKVTELYHPGYIAKRMEIGAVVGAAPAKNVVREEPVPGDKIILVGGRTGRDGIGGATGSSKEHTDESLEASGAEVQKGNPPVERKLQRLFRDAEITQKIKRCNDFGAGGVCVAIGEIADSLEINLHGVPKKYEGLNATELAISESQERMAVVVRPSDVDTFLSAAAKENLEAVVVAEVTDTGRLIMNWHGLTAVNISRDFLNTNGVRQSISVQLESPRKSDSPFIGASEHQSFDNVEERWLEILTNLNSASQKGLGEQFDSSIGSASVLYPHGGLRQESPSDSMVAKVPVPDKDTSTVSLMAHGCDPELLSWSPFHGSYFAIIESITRIVATGGDWKKVRLSLQEYFPKPGHDKKRWGLPYAALLGALKVQKELGIAAIGGKDSMSGSFNELDVPPTLASFAVAPGEADHIVSPELKKQNNHLYLLRTSITDDQLLDIEQYKENMTLLHSLCKEKQIISACSVRHDGVAGTLSRMAFGNFIGAELNSEVVPYLFSPLYGSLLIEAKDLSALEKDYENFICIGKTSGESFSVMGQEISLHEAYIAWHEPLQAIFPDVAASSHHASNSTCCGDEKLKPIDVPLFDKRRKNGNVSSNRPILSSPRVTIPVFPGTNCEWDTAKAFSAAGAVPVLRVFRNLSAESISESITELAKSIRKSQIVMLPGGFSAGDEPEGSGKFIASVFRNREIADAVEDLLQNRDGLILGICNGFQVLVKLGLLPYGKITEMTSDMPTLTYNTIGRHVAKIVRTRITSTLSPWFSLEPLGGVHVIPVSHGEGRFIALESVLNTLIENGQIATQYVDYDGNPTMDPNHNPNGSLLAVESITSPDGRVLGKMAHSERRGKYVGMNVPGNSFQKLFESGVAYFR